MKQLRKWLNIIICFAIVASILPSIHPDAAMAADSEHMVSVGFTVDAVYYNSFYEEDARYSGIADERDSHFLKTESYFRADFINRFCGTLPDASDTVSVSDPFGLPFRDVKYEDKAGVRYFTLLINTNIEKSVLALHGPEIYKFTVHHQDGTDEVFQLLLNKEFYVNSDSIKYYAKMLDLYSVKDGYYENLDHSFFSETMNTDASVKAIDISNEVNMVAIQAQREVDLPDAFESGDYLCADANYISVDGYDFLRFDSSGSRGIHYSQTIPLHKGINVVYIKQAIPTPIFLNGIRSALEQIVKTNVYLLYWDGEPVEKAIASDTKIAQIRAISYAKDQGLDKVSEYYSEVDTIGNQHTVVIPKEMKYPYIILGISLEDPHSVYEITSGQVSGPACGMYLCVDISQNNTIEVKVTAEDGSTEMHTIQVTESDLSQKCDLLSLEVNGGTLEQEFSSGNTTYMLDFQETQIQLIPEISPKAIITINGKTPEEEGYGLLREEDSITHIQVSSEDGLHKKIYNLAHVKRDGSSSYFGISDSTRAIAKEMLNKGWYTNSPEASGDMSDTYWSVFKACATGMDLNNTYVYDVTDHGLNYATDYAAVILELCMTGQNPYDFQGVNYVKGLIDQAKKNNYKSFGAYASNVWAKLAIEASGYDYPYMDQLIQTIKEQLFNPVFDIDIRGWAFAAISEELEPVEKVAFAEELSQECQKKDGNEAGIFMSKIYLSPNANTNGCEITGLLQNQIDCERFAIDDTHSPLLTMKNLYQEDNGAILYNEKKQYATEFNKDAIIALGDILYGNNVWRRQALTRERYQSLLDEAKGPLAANPTDSLLKEAYENASAADGIDGKAYYELLDAMAELDPSVRPSVLMGKPADYNMVETLNNLIKRIPSIDENNLDLCREALNLYSSIEGGMAKKDVKNVTVLSDMKDFLQTYESQVNQVQKGIDDILNSKLSMSLQSRIQAMKEMYQQLSQKQQSMVLNLDKIDEIEIQLFQVSDIIGLIQQIPEITINNYGTVKDELNDIRQRLEQLTAEQQMLVENINVLIANELLIEEIRKEAEEPEPVKKTSTIVMKDKTATYTGQSISAYKAKVTGTSGKVTYKYYSDSACKKLVKSHVNAGTYYVKAYAEGDENYKSVSSRSAKLVIKQAAAKITTKISSESYKASVLKKTAKVFYIGASINSKGKLSYRSSSKRITVSSKGKVIINKNIPKGSYTITINGQATKNYKKACKKVIIKVK